MAPPITADPQAQRRPGMAATRHVQNAAAAAVALLRRERGRAAG
jgi:hypothetical protein